MTSTCHLNEQLGHLLSGHVYKQDTFDTQNSSYQDTFCPKYPIGATPRHLHIRKVCTPVEYLGEAEVKGRGVPAVPVPLEEGHNQPTLSSHLP